MHSMFLIETQIRTRFQSQYIGSIGSAGGSQNLFVKISGKTTWSQENKWLWKSCPHHKIVLQPITKEKKMKITDPRLAKDTTRVPRRSDYEKRPVLSATIHPDINRTLVTISERTGLSVSQVSDEVLYTGLIEMQELWGGGAYWGLPLSGPS